MSFLDFLDLRLTARIRFRCLSQAAAERRAKIGFARIASISALPGGTIIFPPSSEGGRAGSSGPRIEPSPSGSSGLARIGAVEADAEWRARVASRRPEELAILDAQPADEPKAGASLLAELRDRVGVGEPVGRPGDEFGPAAPVTHLACGDQLRDAGAALLAVGAVAWCTVHGNTEVISAEEHAATAPACGARPYPAGSEGDDGTECALPAGHAGPHDGAIADDEASGGVLFGPFETRTLALVPPAAGQ